MKYAGIVIAAIIVAAIILVVIIINDKKKRGQSSQQYLDMLSELYSQKSVIDSLCEIRDVFKKGTVEYIAVDKSIFYLTKSIVRDYTTAFSIIEKVFKDKRVKDLHLSIVEKEKENIVLLLQNP